MTKFETMDNVAKSYVALSEEELVATEGGFAITATGVIGAGIVIGFGGLGIYLGLK